MTQLNRKPKPGELLTPDFITSFAMVQGNENHFTKIVMDGVVWHWVGIGWIETDDEPAADLPVIVDHPPRKTN